MARTLTFITGVEGTGTTLLLRLLSAPAGCAALGGNHFALPLGDDAKPLADAFAAGVNALWDGQGDPDTRDTRAQEVARSLAVLRASPAYAGVDHLIFKRSVPFGRPRDRFRPEPADVLALDPEARIVVMRRDPRAAAYSSLRRFGGTLREVAASVAGNLDRLSRQLAALPAASVREVSYAQLCADRDCYPTVARFCGLPVAPVPPLECGADARYRAELPPDDLAWLDAFFAGRQ